MCRCLQGILGNTQEDQAKGDDPRQAEFRKQLGVEIVRHKDMHGAIAHWSEAQQRALLKHGQRSFDCTVSVIANR